MNGNKKRILAAVIAVVAVFAIGGGYVITRNDKKNVAVKEKAASVETSASMKEAQSDLNKAQKAYDTAKKTYDGLPDSADKEERQKAYDSLKTSYDNLTVAQGTMKRRTTNSADVEKIDKEKEENEKFVLAAEKKLTDVQKSSDKKETVAKATPKPTAKATESAKPTEKPTAKATVKANTQKQTVKQNPAPAQPKKQIVANNKSTTVQPKAPAAKPDKVCHVVNHPAVTHQEPVYQTVHHDEVSHTENYVVTPAWDEQVAAGAVYVCNDCGARFNTPGELALHGDAVHDYPGVGYHTEPIYKTVHHDAVMGQRKVVDHAAYDERVQTGTRTVTDKSAWSENICN